MTISSAATGAVPFTPPVSSRLRRPILVSTDGTPASDPALLAARLLAARFGVPVHVVSVVPPQLVPTPIPESIPIPIIPVTDIVGARRDRIREELARVFGDAVAWSLDVRNGVVPIEIANAAQEMKAQLVVTGHRHRGRLDRLLRGETPLAILNQTQLPTLAVPPGVLRLPRNVLVAVEAGETSVDAARFARPFLEEAETVYLVHVQPEADVAPPLMASEFDRAHLEALHDAFVRVANALELPAHVHVERKVFMGSVAYELLDFAEYAKVDLIVTGHRRRPLVARMFSGGTAARLYHDATKAWLLMVPEETR